MSPLWDETDFERYAQFCRGRGYCSPWHPFVGSDYGAPGRLKLLYCGGSAWWGEQQDSTPLSRAKLLTDQFVGSGMYSTPFWRLFERIAKLAYPDVVGRENAAMYAAWTNLSKTGVVGASAPPDSDEVLRQMDIAQLNRELAILRPDVLVCVSGSLVPSTGHAIFDACDEVELMPVTPSTWLRKTSWGGSLLWTMHPAYKSEEWLTSVEEDFSKLLRSLDKPLTN